VLWYRPHDRYRPPTVTGEGRTPMWPVTLILALLSLCTWLVGVAYAAGPGDPYKMSPLCWVLLLIFGIIILVLLGLYLKEKKKNQGS
jgi:hypothetical protein